MGDNSRSQSTRSELEQLCAQARAGQPEALARLIKRHVPRLRQFAKAKIGTKWQGHIEPDDVVQDALVDLARQIGTFEYRGADSFHRWARQFVEHRFLDAVRHWSRQRRDPARLAPQVIPGASSYDGLLDRCLARLPAPSQAARRKEAIDGMLGAMVRLPDEYREVVNRVYLREEPLGEVAARMGRSPDAVRRMAGRAIDRLAELMSAADFDTQR